MAVAQEILKRDLWALASTGNVYCYGRVLYLHCCSGRFRGYLLVFSLLWGNGFR